MKFRRTGLVPVVLLLALAGLLPAQKHIPEYGYQIVHTYPHDRTAYTQGLEFRDGVLYEGTGLNGRSTLRKVKLETGEILQQIRISSEHFGEGITFMGDEIAELTWQSHVGFVYRKSDFALLRRFNYSGEGWGLTTDGTQVYMSDGTAEIRILKPGTLAELRRIKVHDGAQPIEQLNELEYVEGEIYANIYQTDRIARISPRTGEVLGWINLAGILSPMYRNGSEDVLNGIAYDRAGKRLFVTGKLWPSLFEIRLVRKGP